MFMLKKLVMMLIGRVSIVIMVRVKRMWLFCLLSLVVIFFCSSLICLFRVVRLLIIRENFLVVLCSFCRLVFCSYFGGWLSRCSSELGFSVSRCCRCISMCCMVLRLVWLVERCRVSSWFSMWFIVMLVLWMIWVSMLFWLCNRWISNCRGEWKGLLCFIEECSLFIECSGCVCVLISSWLWVQIYRVVMFEEIRLKLKIMLLIIVSSVELMCLMCVECEFLCRFLKKYFGSFRCFFIQCLQVVWVRFRCSQRNLFGVFL